MYAGGRRTFFNFSQLIGAGFATISLLLVVGAVVYIGPSRKGDARIVLGSTTLAPSWLPITWGTQIIPGEDGWQVEPKEAGEAWVGFRIQRTRRELEDDPQRPLLDLTWTRIGALKFALRGDAHRGEDPHPPPPLQVFLHTDPAKRAGHGVRLKPWHSATGRWDEEPGAWHEIVLPLRLFACPPDTPLFGISFQVVGELHHPFRMRDVFLTQLSHADLARFSAPDPGTAHFPALIELTDYAFLRTALPSLPRAEIDRYVAAWSQPGAVTALTNWYRASLLSPPDSLGRITVPTVVVWGEDERLLVPELAGASVPECDQGRLELIPGAGHWVQVDAPMRVNRVLSDMVAAVA